MAALEGLVVGAVDGVIKQQAAVRADAYSVECITQPTDKIPHIHASSLERDLTYLWQQYYQSHFRDEIAGLYHCPEFCQCHFLRQPKYEPVP